MQSFAHGEFEGPHQSLPKLMKHRFPNTDMIKDPRTKKFCENGDTFNGWIGQDVHFLFSTIKGGSDCCWVLTHRVCFRVMIFKHELTAISRMKQILMSHGRSLASSKTCTKCSRTGTHCARRSSRRHLKATLLTGSSFTEIPCPPGSAKEAELPCWETLPIHSCQLQHKVLLKPWKMA